MTINHSYIWNEQPAIKVKCWQNINEILDLSHSSYVVLNNICKYYCEQNKLENSNIFCPVKYWGCLMEVNILGIHLITEDKLGLNLTWVFPVYNVDSLLQQTADSVLIPAGYCCSGPTLSVERTGSWPLRTELENFSLRGYNHSIWGEKSKETSK